MVGPSHVWLQTSLICNGCRRNCIGTSVSSKLRAAYPTASNCLPSSAGVVRTALEGRQVRLCQHCKAGYVQSKLWGH